MLPCVELPLEEGGGGCVHDIGCSQAEHGVNGADHSTTNFFFEICVGLWTLSPFRVEISVCKNAGHYHSVCDFFLLRKQKSGLASDPFTGYSMWFRLTVLHCLAVLGKECEANPRQETQDKYFIFSTKKRHLYNIQRYKHIRLVVPGLV